MPLGGGNRGILYGQAGLNGGIYMTTGSKLSKLRKENNYTQEQLAVTLGVSRQAVSKWENDMAYPETDKILKISELFGCSADYLLKENSNTDKEEASVCQMAGKIVIASFDNKNVVACQKVQCSKIIAARKDEPKYVLYGTGSVSFWGGHNTVLGWYESLEKVQQEISQITEAISQGKPSYKLKYAADIEFVGIFGQPKLKKHL